MNIWFYQFPEEMPLYIPQHCPDESEARAWIRRQHECKRLPKGTLVWRDEIGDRWRDVRDSEAARLRDQLIKAEVPYRLRTVARLPHPGRELRIDLGPIEMFFDIEGNFIRMEWYEPEYDEGGGTVAAYRGREHGQH